MDKQAKQQPEQPRGNDDAIQSAPIPPAPVPSQAPAPAPVAKPKDKWRLPKQKKAPKQDLWSLPPEGLWVSPSGQRQDVNEHLLAIRQSPEEFGLSPQDVQGLDLDGIRQLAEGLIDQGWTRYRYLDGVYHFEVDSAKRRMSVINDILGLARAIPQEQVVITQRQDQPPTIEGTAEQVFEGTLLRFAKADPWAWKTRQG